MRNINEISFWNGNSPLTEAYKDLEKIMPVTGEFEQRTSKKPNLERMRKAGNAYYDFYNNGLLNRASEFRYYFKISLRKDYFMTGRDLWFRGRPSNDRVLEIMEKVERKMKQYVEKAWFEAVELGLIK